MGLWAIFVPLLLSTVSESAISCDDCLIGISGIDGGAGSTLREGQTLVSAGGRFVFGFFSPGGSSGRRYLGVLYRNISSPAIWVANRDRPIADTGVLVLTAAGVLVLCDSTWVIWRAIPKKPVRSPVLRILDSGNLVLGDLAAGEVSEYTWQSFDHPCNVLIPGMRLGWDLKSGSQQSMTSWRSPEDPAAGDLTLSLDRPELPQLVLRSGLKTVNRWGPLDRPNFSGPMTIPGFKQVMVSSPEEVYYTIFASDESVPVMMELTETGLVSFLAWSNRTKNWLRIATLPNDSCEKYGTCGPNSYCHYNDHDHEPDCRCLDGFVPENRNDWDSDHRTGGCVRRWRLGYGNGDRFVRFSRLKLPDGSRVADGNKNLSRRECELECLVNSSCTAYTVMNLLYPIGSGCVMWFGDLVDTRSFVTGGHDIYVRMAHQEIDSSNQVERTRQVEITLLIVMSLCCVMCILTVIGLKMIIVGNESRKAREDRIVPTNIEHERHDGEARNEETMDLLPLYDLATLSVATNLFSSDNKIGQGGFGFVYKGVLPNGQEIAVKRLSRSSSQGLQQFKNEVILVAKLQHRNLVKLLGCCIQGEERMLVYEYLSNKSLDNFLFGHSRSNILTWDTRYNIILGIARGLLYLHEDSRLRIIHRDLKTSNILLDSDMTPKISDFGIASIFGGDQTEERTRRVLGTYGYMSPEYAIRGHFSIKSDVFSFGVLMLEVISGTHNWSFHHPDHDSNLLGHAWKLWSEGNAIELVDPFMEGSFCVEEVMRCIQVGLLCVQQGTDDRPMISSVIFMLSNEIAAIPHPKEPGFFSGASYSGTHEYVEASSGGQNICTTELTVSDIQGR